MRRGKYEMNNKITIIVKINSNKKMVRSKIHHHPEMKKDLPQNLILNLLVEVGRKKEAIVKAKAVVTPEMKVLGVKKVKNTNQKTLGDCRRQDQAEVLVSLQVDAKAVKGI